MMGLMNPDWTSFTIIDESGVVTVYVPGWDFENPNENYASFTHVLTDETNFSNSSLFLST